MMNWKSTWQILSAYRSDPSFGTATVNRYVHERYRFPETMKPKNCTVRSTKHLLGTDGICYGDKVIKIRNQKKTKKSGYPAVYSEGYVTNGEVGIVIYGGLCFYWEHCGMLDYAGYSRNWNEKKALYEKHGIVEGENLIGSKDSLSGAIDSAEIKRLIDTYLM